MGAVAATCGSVRSAVSKDIDSARDIIIMSGSAMQQLQ